MALRVVSFRRSVSPCHDGKAWGRFGSTFRNLGCVAEGVRQPLQEGGGDFDSVYAWAGRG